MLRNTNIYINPEVGSIVDIEGDASFFYKDNNSITVIVEDDNDYIVCVSANIPGNGSIIAKLIKNNNFYVLKDGDMDAFLEKVGTISCNIHVSDAEGNRITTLPFKIKSLMASDRNAKTAVAPSNNYTLEDFYIALDVIKNLNITEIEDAVKIVESLDINRIEEALEVVNGLDDKIEELDKTITDSKEVNDALNLLITTINQMLENGDFDGEDGYTPQKGIDYFDGKPGEPGKDYVLTIDDKTEIANTVYTMFVDGEEVRF